MRYLLLWLLLLQTFFSAAAKSPVDTSSYEAQRVHVNSLLDKRAKKFGDLNQSFNQKSGIFGLVKTKKDMQSSINILQEIVQYDNMIFIETRKLLTIKDNHANAFQQLASEYDEQVTAYMKTVSKLQAENEKLRQQITDNKPNQGFIRGLFIVAAILMLLVFVFVFRRIAAKK